MKERRALKLQARLEDLTIWEMKVVKESRKSCKINIYWIASWREGQDAQMHLGSARKIDAEAARQKVGI